MKKLFWFTIAWVAALFSRVTGAPSQTEVVAAVIWAEARGEGLMGMRMVAEVIENRRMLLRSSGGYGTIWVRTAYEVVIEPKQFSCLNTWGAAKLVAFAKASTGPDRSAWEACLQLAEQLVQGTFENFNWTQGATHYHSVAVRPAWAGKLQCMVEYRNHIFYK